MISVALLKFMNRDKNQEKPFHPLRKHEDWLACRRHLARFLHFRVFPSTATACHNTSLSYPPSLSTSRRKATSLIEGILTDTTLPPLPPHLFTHLCISAWGQEMLWMEPITHSASQHENIDSTASLSLLLISLRDEESDWVKEDSERRRRGRRRGGGSEREASKG